MEYFNLTHPQKRIWYLEKLNSDSKINTISGLMEISDSINVDYLMKAIQLVIKNNDGLRIRLKEINGEVNQYISSYQDEVIQFIDFTIYEDNNEQFHLWCKEKIEDNFELLDTKLYDFYVYKRGPEKYGILLKIHHIITDGWAMGIIEKQISKIYEELISDNHSNFPENYSYINYIKKEKDYLGSKRFLKDKKYWNEKFSELPDTNFESFNHTLKGERVKYKISTERSHKLKQIAKKHKVSLSAIFIAAKILYISKIEAIEDIIIGVPVLNRSGIAEKNTIGMFTSTMPLRIKLDRSMSLTEVVKTVHLELKSGLFHQKYPYDLLVNDLNLRKRGQQNLFSTAVNYYLTKYSTEIGTASIAIDSLYQGEQWYPLQMIIEESDLNDEMNMYFDYKLSDYSREDIELMNIYIMNIIDAFINKENLDIKSLDITSSYEFNYKIKIFNDTFEKYPNWTVIQLFEDQVRRNPDYIAIMDGNTTLTYYQVQLNINRLANYLYKRGIKKGDKVAILSTHSIKVVEWMLAIMKVGAAFIPIDPSYPIKRINYMLNDSSAKILYSNVDTASVDFNGEILIEGKFDITCESVDFNNQSTLNDIAYIIYTSGSTGVPKGVMIEHKGLTNYSIWASKQYLRDEIELFAFFSSISFDLTITSIFAPLVSGKTIDVYQDDGEEFVLYKILRQNRATVVKLTPSHLALIQSMPINNFSIRRFIVGGENLTVKLAQSIYNMFNSNIEIFNEYGPTEASVGCMAYKYNHMLENGESVPIGKPASNVSIYLVDKYNQLVPFGRTGEIIIAGAGVAKGYLNKPELTEKTFMKYYGEIFKGQRIYRTGDLAKWLPSGDIEYIGRVDAELKIRGYRIHLSEIENALLNIDGINNVVVKDFKGEHGQKILCAYIQGFKKYEDREIKRELIKQIPMYMIPTHYIYINKIPLTQNGKVDYKRLPHINQQSKETVITVYQDETRKVFIEVLQEVLAHTKFDLKDNFFQIGGDSIKAILIVSKLKELGYSLSVNDIMQNETIEEILPLVTISKGKLEICQGTIEGEIEQTPIIKWFFEQEFHNQNYFNQSVLLELTNQELKDKSIEFALHKLITYHDTLRINYDKGANNLYYNNELLHKEIDLSYYDLTEYEGNDFNKKLLEIGLDTKSSFDIENGWLFKTRIIRVNKERRLILLTAHHLVIDGISWRILLDDFSKLLNQSLNNDIGNLPSKSHSFKYWSKALLEYSECNLEEEKAYWQKIISECSDYSGELCNYKTCNQVDSVNVLTALSTINHEVDAISTQGFINALKKSYRMDIHEGIIAVLALSVNKITNMRKVVFEIERHGREQFRDDIDISRTIGWFTSMYPVILEIQDVNLDSNIRLLKEAQRNVPAKGFHFGILKYLREEFQNYNSKLIRVNYLGDFDNLLDSSLFRVVHFDTGSDTDIQNQLTYLVEVNAMIIGGSLKLEFKFDNNTFSEMDILELISAFQEYFQAIYKYCTTVEENRFTPSDFDGIDLSQEEINFILD